MVQKACHTGVRDEVFGNSNDSNEIRIKQKAAERHAS
jgi:hypothetical protein